MRIASNLAIVIAGAGCHAPQGSAGSVIDLYRDEVDHPNSPDRGLADLSVLKRQLSEEVGTVRSLVWGGESYRDYARQHA
jgi:hypothetical protein